MIRKESEMEEEQKEEGEQQKTVFVVTAGDYSDFRIIAIFSSKKEAEDYMQWRDKLGEMDYDHFNDIEVWPLGSPEYKRPDGRIMYRVMFWEKSEAHDLSPSNNVMIHDEVREESFHFHEGQTNTLSPFAKQSTIIVVCLAKDKEHALKIASDKRAKFYAEREGL